MADISTQKAKAESFKALHHSGKLLVLPNIWDPLSAAMLESLGYPAIATASASVAFTNGYNDGENIPFENALSVLTKIAGSVNIPVTADIESGYGATETALQKNIERIIAAGIVGINLEDFDKHTDSFFPVNVQCERIRLIRKISETMQVPLFINARTDVFYRGKEFLMPEEKFNETVNRGKAYIDAGADCFFPLAVKRQEDLQQLISILRCPLNVIAIQGIPDMITLQEIGVARLSLGPGFLKTAIRALRDLAIKLKNLEGLEDVTGNDVTTDYLKNLVLKTRQPN
jgi:2-methylisocitrate lyase-like PEP mutase family enzyme